MAGSAPTAARLTVVERDEADRDAIRRHASHSCRTGYNAKLRPLHKQRTVSGSHTVLTQRQTSPCCDVAGNGPFPATTATGHYL